MTDIAAIREAAEQATQGAWEVFIADDGGEWTGWPLSISSVDDCDKTIVRPGGHYPYEWDAAMSQREAVANATHIANCSPATILALLADLDRMREALEPFAACADQIADTEDDEEWAKFRLLVSDYRRARAALNGGEHV